MKNKKFNLEFKKMIVEFYYSNRSVKELSSEYSVSEVTIYKWIKKYSPVTTSDEVEMTLDDLKRMQSEILRLEEENKILKKAMAILAKNK